MKGSIKINIGSPERMKYVIPALPIVPIGMYSKS
jgi:hypothetical protein